MGAGRAFQFFNWRGFGAVGPVLPEPLWVSWEPECTLAALAYAHTIELCRTRPSFERFASLSIADAQSGTLRCAVPCFERFASLSIRARCTVPRSALLRASSLDPGGSMVGKHGGAWGKAASSPATKATQDPISLLSGHPLFMAAVAGRKSNKACHHNHTIGSCIPLQLHTRRCWRDRRLAAEQKSCRIARNSSVRQYGHQSRYEDTYDCALPASKEDSQLIARSCQTLMESSIVGWMCL